MVTNGYPRTARLYFVVSNSSYNDIFAEACKSENSLQYKKQLYRKTDSTNAHRLRRCSRDMMMNVVGLGPQACEEQAVSRTRAYAECC